VPEIKVKLMNALGKHAARKLLVRELTKIAQEQSLLGRVGGAAKTLFRAGSWRPKQAPVLGPKGVASIGAAPPKIRPPRVQPAGQRVAKAAKTLLRVGDWRQQ